MWAKELTYSDAWQGKEITTSSPFVPQGRKRNVDGTMNYVFGSIFPLLWYFQVKYITVCPLHFSVWLRFLLLGRRCLDNLQGRKTKKHFLSTGICMLHHARCSETTR